MKLGVHVVNACPWVTAESTVSLGTRAEALGFGSLWVSYQVVIPSELHSSFSYCVTGQYDTEANQNFFDALSVLTYLAGCTRRVHAYGFRRKASGSCDPMAPTSDLIPSSIPI